MLFFGYTFLIYPSSWTLQLYLEISILWSNFEVISMCASWITEVNTARKLKKMNKSVIYLTCGEAMISFYDVKKFRNLWPL